MKRWTGREGWEQTKGENVIYPTCMSSVTGHMTGTWLSPDLILAVHACHGLRESYHALQLSDSDPPWGLGHPCGRGVAGGTALGLVLTYTYVSLTATFLIPTHSTLTPTPPHTHPLTWAVPLSQSLVLLHHELCTLLANLLGGRGKYTNLWGGGGGGVSMSLNQKTHLWFELPGK